MSFENQLEGLIREWNIVRNNSIDVLKSNIESTTNTGTTIYIDNNKLAEMNTKFQNAFTNDDDVVSSDFLALTNIININKWKEVIGYSDEINTSTGESKTLYDKIDEINNFTQTINTASNTLLDEELNVDLIGSTNYKNKYDNNLKSYTQNKEKIYGAIMQAKENTDIYSLNVSATINLCAGILILLYLIYKANNSGTLVAKTDAKNPDAKKPDAKKPDAKKPDAKKPDA